MFLKQWALISYVMVSVEVVLFNGISEPVLQLEDTITVEDIGSSNMHKLKRRRWKFGLDLIIICISNYHFCRPHPTQWGPKVIRVD